MWSRHRWKHQHLRLQGVAKTLLDELVNDRALTSVKDWATASVKPPKIHGDHKNTVHELVKASLLISRQSDNFKLSISCQLTMVT